MRLTDIPRNAKDIIYSVLSVALGLALGSVLMSVIFGGITLGSFLVGLMGLCVWGVALGLWVIAFGMGWLD